MKRFQGLLNSFNNIMTAVSYAEAGEFDTAKDIVNKTGQDDTAPVKNVLTMRSAFHYYKVMIESNETAIGFITEMSSAKEQDPKCDADHLRNSYAKLCIAMRRSLQHFDILTKYKYHGLRSAYNRVDIEVRRAMNAGSSVDCSGQNASASSGGYDEALKYIAPLNLVDPIFDNFTPEGCRTMHDVIRFMHVKAVYELTRRSAKNLHSVPSKLSPAAR
ncbi:MAG: hypothetical protein AB1499_10825 [Nitrospirota bacterium]